MGLFALAAPGQSAVAGPSADQGLVGRWDFDEGSGTVAHDASGNANHGRLRGASWVKRGPGYALSFDGVDDYADFGNGPSLDLTAAVTIEAWIKPGALPTAEPMVIGKYYDSFALTHYKDGACWFYISGGGNNTNGHIEVGQWNHVAATFDGDTMTLYVNRVKAGSRKSRSSAIRHGGRLLMGALLADPQATDPGYSGTSYWRGLVDDVRIYNRALSEDEVLSHYKLSAGGYGVDTHWFDRVRVRLYPLPADGQVLAVFDYTGVFPRPTESRLTVSLHSRGAGAPPVQRQELASLPASGVASARFPLEGLPAGLYVVEARLSGPGGLEVAGEQAFRLPLAPVQAPSPTQFRVGPLPAAPQPPPYRFRMHPGGGFEVAVHGRRLPFASTFSFPHGGENRLLPGPPDQGGEPSWRVSPPTHRGNTWQVQASGRYYRLLRRIALHPNRVVIRDTLHNVSGADLGIWLDHYLDASRAPFSDWTVAGYPRAVERAEAYSPSTFVAWRDGGLGILPLDDVFVIQSVVYARGRRAGVKSNRFGLAPGAAYTLEWAVYPIATTDYYDFVNEVRRDERRIRTVEGGFAFIPRSGVTPDHVRLRNILYASFGCLTNVADDPEIEIEGIDFLWLPKERARIRSEFEAIRRVNPRLKLMFHVAHSLVSTNRPTDLFPDSRVLDAQGKHVIYAYDYDACAYFSRRRHEEGWRWYIYYPTPGNSFHDALMRSVDAMVDEIGCGGAFMDGFFCGYGSPYTYDRWDRHTVEMNARTKTIRRKVGSVLLLSQPSMVEFTRRMVARGAVVIANNTVMTRTIGRLPIIVDQECRSGPDVHLAQTPCALGNAPGLRTELDVYRDVLDKLKWGNLYFYYGEGTLTRPSLPQRMYPITVTSIHSGIVRGKERIVTLRSGVYGWPGRRELHQGFRYNSVGMPVTAGFVTTVDRSGVRTRVLLDADESAVVCRIPAVLSAQGPVNVVCERYDARGLVLALSGQGRAEVHVRDGELPVGPGARFRISGRSRAVRAGRDGVLRVPLSLSGPSRLAIEPVAGG